MLDDTSPGSAALGSLPEAATLGGFGEEPGSGRAPADEPAAANLGPGGAGHVRAVRGPFLCLELAGALGRQWFGTHLPLLLVVLLLKGLLLEYPEGWWDTEFGFALLACLLQRAQQFSGSYGNRAQSAPVLGASLALTTPLLLLNGYFAVLQVYVLHFDFVLGDLSLVLLLGNLLFTTRAATSFSASGRELALIIIGAFVAVAALTLVLVMAFLTGARGGVVRDVLISGAFLVFLSCLLAACSCVLAIRT